MPLRYLMNYFFPKEEEKEIIEIEPPYDKQREIELNKLYNTILNRDCKKEELEYYMRFKFPYKKIEKVLINSSESRKIKDRIFNMESWINFCEEYSYFIKSISFKEPPDLSNNNLVFIDFRFLENFEFVIRNALIKLQGNFMTTFVCNNNNYEKVELLCNNISKSIKVLKLENNADSRISYNNLLLKPDFWEKLEGENLLIHQFDAIIFKNNISDFIEYDYIGSPINTDNGIIMNGGFSFRKKTKMIKLLEKYKPERIFEDKFFNSKVLLDLEIAKKFGTQDFESDAFGGHQFWSSVRYKPLELYQKLTKINKYDKYSSLFHKFYLNLNNPDKEICYRLDNIGELNKKLICHIHCYQINKFEEYFLEYVGDIKKYFDIIVTYSRGITSLDELEGITILNIENIGGDIGGKFSVTKYLSDIKYDYDFIMMIHSKTNDKKRKSYMEPLMNNLKFISNNLDKEVGIYCHKLILKGCLMLIDTNDKITLNNKTLEASNWGRNSKYMSEVSEYLNLPDYNQLFPEGNFYIISSDVNNFMYSDKLLYNSLNKQNSFDYQWVNNYYNKKEDNVIKVYQDYKKEKLYGNNFSLNLGWEGLADCMIEHIFERLPFGICKKLNKKVHLLDYKYNTKFNDILFKNEIDISNLKPVTLLACHSSNSIKYKAIVNNIKYLKSLSDEIYIINSREYKGEIEKRLKGDETLIVNDIISDYQAKKYLNEYSDLAAANLTIEQAKDHWKRYNAKEKREISNTTKIIISYAENDKYLGQGKWFNLLATIKNNYNSFILTNDSFFITRELLDFEKLYNKNYDMVSILDSNEIKHHYPDFLRYYSNIGIEFLISFYQQNLKKCNNTDDIIKFMEIDSTYCIENRECVYKMDKKFKGNIHFTDEVNKHYLYDLDYPIIKIKKLLLNYYEKIPEDFNASIYASLHEDLKSFDLEEAKNHFKNHGMKEGRIYKEDQEIELPKFLENYMRERKLI